MVALLRTASPRQPNSDGEQSRATLLVYRTGQLGVDRPTTFHSQSTARVALDLASDRQFSFGPAASESDSAAIRPVSATNEKSALSAADFRFDPTVSREGASTPTNVCAVSAHFGSDAPPGVEVRPDRKQVRLRMTIALGSLCSTKVDMGSGCGEAGAEGRGASSVDWR